MNILSGWREQYDRMIRSRGHLAEVVTGSGSHVVDSDDARDILVYFYMNAYHLKDWIKNDPATSSAAGSVEGFVGATAALRLCADLANGVKHLKLTRQTKTGDSQTSFSSQSVVVRPGTIRARATVNDEGQIAAIRNTPSDEPKPALHTWEVRSSGQAYDALELADEIVDAWKAWLQHPQQHLM
ncbi:hypothetical protein [Paractinoplanes maris]|uniref:hypothetical protein n=1 Tax=Paractinoplanes maris TaxID=1734446 RepID=UPI0020222719|nr:hypothetical protein [Actinoplanes maris]